MTMVKICGMTSRDAVKDAVGAGADAVGFVFAESVRRIDPATARDIAVDIPKGVRRVAVMLHPTNDEWLEVYETFRPDVLQTDTDDLAGLDIYAAVEVWPVYRQGLSEPADDAGDAFVYEGRASGTGQTVDWQTAAAVATRGRMILAGGLSAENVAEAIRTVQPFGVDASSSLEAAPGRKDAQKIRAFLNAVRHVDQELAK